MADASAESQRTPEPGKPRRRKRRWLRWVIGIVVVLVILIIALAAALPSILDTAAGRQWALGLINGNIEGKVAADDLDVSWLGGQSISGLSLRDAQGHVIIQNADLRAPDLSLWDLLTGTQHYGKIDITADAIHVRQQPGQPTNLSRAVSSPSAKPRQASTSVPSLGSDTQVQLRFTAKKITYEGPGIEKATVHDFSTKLDMADPQHIHAAMTGQLEQAGRTGKIDATVQLDNAFDSQGRLQLAAATVQGHGEVDELPLAVVDRLMNQHGRLAALLGPELSGKFTANGPMRSLDGAVTAQSQYMRLNAGVVGSRDRLAVKSGSVLKLTVTPAAFALLASPTSPVQNPTSKAQGPATSPNRQIATSPNTQDSRLKMPVTVNVAVNKLIVPMSGRHVDLDGAAVDAAVTLTPVLLDVPGSTSASLKQAKLSITSARLGKQLTLALSGVAEAGGVSKPVSAKLVIDQPLAKGGPDKAALDASDLPVALVDAVANQHGRLTHTLGSTLDATLRLARQADNTVTFAGKVSSANLAGPVQGKLGPGRVVSLSTPQPLTLTLTPAAMADWLKLVQQGKPAVALAQPTQIALHVAEVQVALLPAAPGGPGAGGSAIRLDPDQTHVDVTLTLPTTTLIDPATQRRVTIEQGNLSVKAKNLRDLLQLLANFKFPAPEATESSKFKVQGAKSQPAAGAASGGSEGGSLQINVQAHHVLSPQGAFQPRQASVDGTAKAQAVPSQLMALLGERGGQVAQVLGDRTNAAAEVHYAPDAGGPVRLQIDSDNVQGELAGRIDGDGVLTLDHDAQVHLRVTPTVGRVALAKINPMLIQAASSKSPIALTLPAKGFALPLEPFDVSKIEANARLELGTIVLSNGGLLRTLLGGLAAFGTVNARYAQQLPVQFSDTVLSMNDGILAYEQPLTMTIDNLVLRFDGRVNVADNQLHLAVHIPGSSLNKIFDIKALASQEITIPVTGSIEQPQIEPSKIASEMARMELQKGLGGVLGDLLNGNKSSQSQPAASQPHAATQPAKQKPTIGDVLKDLLKKKKK